MSIRRSHIYVNTYCIVRSRWLTLLLGEVRSEGRGATRFANVLISFADNLFAVKLTCVCVYNCVAKREWDQSCALRSRIVATRPPTRWFIFPFASIARFPRRERVSRQIHKFSSREPLSSPRLSVINAALLSSRLGRCVQRTSATFSAYARNQHAVAVKRRDYLCLLHLENRSCNWNMNERTAGYEERAARRDSPWYSIASVSSTILPDNARSRKIWGSGTGVACRERASRLAAYDAGWVIKWLICELLGDAPAKCDK